MTDTVADRSELESSATSLNCKSWLPGDGGEDSSSRVSILLQGREKKEGGVWESAKEEDRVSDVSAATTSVYGHLDSTKEQSSFITNIFLGKLCGHQRFGWVEWLFIVVATLSMAGTFGMSIERFVSLRREFSNMTANSKHSFSFINGTEGNVSGDNREDSLGKVLYCTNWTCLNDFNLALVVLVNLVFAMYYCIDGLIRERSFEIIGYIITTFIILYYVILDYCIEGEQRDITKLIRLVIFSLLGPLNILLALVVQYRMGFLILYTIDGNRQLTRAYHTRSLFLTVQCFNLQILINIMILSWAKAGHFSDIWEKIVLPVLIVYILLISCLGWVAVLWEKRILVLMWNILVVISFGYYLFKIVNVGVHWSYYKRAYMDYHIRGESPSNTHFLYMAIVMIITCIFGMLTSVTMTVLMMATLYNFGQGLKERMPPPCCVGHKNNFLLIL